MIYYSGVEISVIAIIKEVLISFAAVVTACAAWSGLKTWSKQLAANLNTEVSRALLRALFKVREDISDVRFSIIAGAEYVVALQKVGIPEVNMEDKESRWKADAAVYQVRLDKLNNSIAEFNAAIIEAEVLWGQDIKTLAKPLFKKIGQLKSAIRMYLRSLKREGEKLRGKDATKIDEVLYDDSKEGEPDAYFSEVLEIIGEIEKFIRKRFPYQKESS
ncbi:MAG TPA: hypothetical protein PLA03_13335 [Acidobacteriota bacterium]|nr:hypothetical protein [Acidobacteriota bacterium]